MISVVLLFAPLVNAQCPAYGADTTCGTVITISLSAAGALQASVSQTGQGPYDGNDDTLVGVINNSNVPITSLGLSSGFDIFGFDGDGVDTYGAPGNSYDSTGYGGPNAYFTKINANLTSGTINFITPISINGGTSYFSLENALSNATTCSTIIDNAVSTPSLGGLSLSLQPTNISATFKPNGGLTLSQAAQSCGFVNFDWIQQIDPIPDPSPFCEVNSDPNLGNPTPFCQIPPVYVSPFPLHLTSGSVPLNDPAPNGYTYNPAWVSYPFYWDPRTTSQRWSLAQYETLNGAVAPITSANTLSSYDAPSDWCISGPLGLSSFAYLFGVPTLSAAQVQASCGNSTTPVGSYNGFTTHLAGVNADGTGFDLGIGYSWTSNFNGTTGGIATTASYSPTDVGSGVGGIIVTGQNGITNYQYPKGATVTSVNGSTVLPPPPSLTLLSGLQLARTASGLAYSRSNQTFNGTVTITNVSASPINGPFQIVLHSLTAGVTLKNATGVFGGEPYITVPSIGGLAPGQSTTVNVQFRNPSNTTVKFLPVPYSGSFS